jgi:hypothetical protein
MPIIIKPNGKELEVNENTIKAMREEGALPDCKIKVSEVKKSK